MSAPLIPDEAPQENLGRSQDATPQKGNGGPVCPEPSRALHELLEALWNRSQALIVQRLGILGEAQRRLQADANDSGARVEGADAAHKLAGILGTFGMPKGTELARAAEELLENGAGLKEGQVAELGGWVNELEAMIRGRSNGAGPVIK
jgi:HPt (histidine-containing phosphotransfer) domain-containing protein